MAKYDSRQSGREMSSQVKVFFLCTFFFVAKQLDRILVQNPSEQAKEQLSKTAGRNQEETSFIAIENKRISLWRN